MKIKLAGYNIDKSLIDQVPDHVKATPEVLSAAYARISRSSKNVTELRKDALEEVEKSRISNQKIIYEMGHSSVAEHAVFNFDIIGVSRYLAEYIQMSRLASFTEKSQRYVTIDGNYIVPPEIANSEAADKYIDFMNMMFKCYQDFYIKALSLPEVEQIQSKRDREGRAKEDARYFLPLATATQMGMTINARNLEKLIKRMDSLDLDEAAEFKTILIEEVSGIAPSLLKYIISDDSDPREIFAESKIQTSEVIKTRLIQYDYDADVKILAHLLFQDRGGSIRGWMDVFEELDQAFQKRYFDKLFHNMKSYHSVPRAFEFANFTFETTMSACCYAQFKRHRIATIQRAPYSLQDSLIIPPLLKNEVSDDFLLDVNSKMQDLYSCIENIKPSLAPYVCLNAQKVQVIFQMNLREIYHFVRLRSDSHAQWEIRNLSDRMIELVKDKCPLSASALMGKDQFDQRTV